MAKPPKKRDPQKACDQWNAIAYVGMPVNYRNDLRETKETKTRTAASVLGGHSAVIWLEGVGGCVALDRVHPL